MGSLRETLQHEMAGYAGKALNGYSYLLDNADQDIFAVISIAQLRDERIADAGLIVRLVDDKIIIELDLNSKPLVDALVQAGVPREQIVLAYAGESVAEAA